MLILLVEQHVGLMYLGEAIEEWSTCELWWRQVMSGYVIYLVSVVKIIKGGKDIVSDCLSWVGTKFFVCGGVGQVFLNFADVKRGAHEAYPTPLVKWFDDQIWI